MDAKYDHHSIDTKWQAKWDELNLYKTPDIQPGQSKKYILDAFAYPSGQGLHAGHAEGYTGTDIVARYYRLKGEAVLYPVGWDAFGLPAENYAIKTGLHPRVNTDTTIGFYQKQVKSLGLSNDWADEIATHNPEYYRWTQWFFSFLYKRGLAYKKEALVNWDPVDQTVLANEQVLPDGTAERSGAKVEQRMLSQWFFKITDYAERLLQDLDKVDWPESTKQMQRNWIGKSEGAVVRWGLSKPGYPVFGQADDIDWSVPARVRSVVIIRIRGTQEYLVYRQARYDFQNVYFPGGAVDPGESPWQAGVRETMEEIGVSNLQLVKSLGACHKFMRYGQSISHGLEHYFLAELDRQDLDKRQLAEVDDPKKDLYGRLELVSKEVIRANGWAQIDWVMDLLEQPAQQEIEIFTTRLDTIFGATYLVLAPEHHLVDSLTTLEQRAEVEEYQLKTKQKTQLQRTDLNKDKTGVWTGSFAVNPLNGKSVPVFIADYVLSTYGTGAIMAVPAHDQRDFEFAESMNKQIDDGRIPGLSRLECPKVVAASDSLGADLEPEVLQMTEVFTEYGVLCNSGEYTGLDSQKAKGQIAQWLEEKGLGRLEVTYRLRDWLVSRQRYWGAPIPIVYDESGQEHLVDESELPVLLPEDVEFAPTGRSPLYDHQGFHAQAKLKYGAKARREIDTMDTFVCSSWYMFRFTDPLNTKVFADTESVNRWMPVDEYVIGAEHTVLHLLYARFFTKVLYDAGLVDYDEPFRSMRHPGMILGEDNRKMSKRWGNVVNPVDVVEEYGADTLRIYEMFMGPFDQSKAWNTKAIKGVRRFLDRVWKMQARVYSLEKPVIEALESQGIAYGPKVEAGLESHLHRLIKKLSQDIPKFAFNTAIAECMKFVNTVEETGALTQSQWRRFLIILSPLAPYLTEELWQNSFGRGVDELSVANSVHKQVWPTWEESMILQDGVVIGVQVNGKLRSQVEVTGQDDLTEVQARVLADEQVQKWLQGKPVKKVIYVPMKIVNVVV